MIQDKSKAAVEGIIALAIIVPLLVVIGLFGSRLFGEYTILLNFVLGFAIGYGGMTVWMARNLY